MVAERSRQPRRSLPMASTPRSSTCTRSSRLMGVWWLPAPRRPVAWSLPRSIRLSAVLARPLPRCSRSSIQCRCVASACAMCTVNPVLRLICCTSTVWTRRHRSRGQVRVVRKVSMGFVSANQVTIGHVAASREDALHYLSEQAVDLALPMMLLPSRPPSLLARTRPRPALSPVLPFRMPRATRSMRRALPCSSWPSLSSGRALTACPSMSRLRYTCPPAKLEPRTCVCFPRLP